MEEINKFRVFNKLKKIYRFNSVDDRKESSAEHSWSCLILADYIISRFNIKINQLRVYELLMYHDVVEIESGDFILHPKKTINKDKKKIEKIASKKLAKKIPEPLNKKFLKLFSEFEEQKTLEARFAKAIDKLDAEIHELDYKEDWKGWTEEFLIDSKMKYFEEFPEIKEMFLEIIKFLRKNNYFDN